MRARRNSRPDSVSVRSPAEADLVGDGTCGGTGGAEGTVGVGGGAGPCGVGDQTDRTQCVGQIPVGGPRAVEFEGSTRVGVGGDGRTCGLGQDLGHGALTTTYTYDTENRLTGLASGGNTIGASSPRATTRAAASSIATTGAGS